MLEADIALVAQDDVPNKDPVILPLTLKDPVIVVFPTIVVLPIIEVEPVIDVDPVTVNPLLTVTPPFVNVEEPETMRLSLAVNVPISTVRGPLKCEDPVTDNAGIRLLPLLIVVANVVLSTPSNGKLTINDPVATVKEEDCIVVEPDSTVFPIFVKLPDIIAEPVNGNVPPITDRAKDAVAAFCAKDELNELEAYEADVDPEAYEAEVAFIAVVAVVAKPAVVADVAVFAFSAYNEYEDVIEYEALTDCEELTAFKTYEDVFENEALKAF
jgi:hypothetical protein